VLSVLSVGLSLSATFLLQPSVVVTPLFFPSIILSTWFGGMGPGLLAVALSALSINYFFLNPERTIAISHHDIPYLVAFLLSALLVSSWSAARRRAEQALRRARDELETKVQERTGDLRRSNQQLQIEIAERERADAERVQMLVREQAANEALREQASLLDLTHDTVFVRDMQDLITYWNGGAEKLYGWTRDEAVGKVSHQLTQTVFPVPLGEINAELLSTGHWEGELIHTKRDGEQVVVASRWSLQQDAQGNAIAVLETNNNITERKQAEEALGKAEAELAHLTRMTTMGELAASIAHEVNQPLTAVITNANACLRWLAGVSPNLDEAREGITRIVRDGNRASEVIKRIRALLKKTAPQKTHLNINDPIKEILTLAQSEIRRNRVLLTADLTPDLPPVFADRVQLQQVVLNLVINGIEAMTSVTSRPRNLVVKTQKSESNNVMVLVQDSGVGIDPRNADRLFEAFYTTKAEGMGMGLSISRSMVEAHGGKLWASANSGNGATFQFTIPGDEGTRS
jgi:PAS domain S-box-containing protein